MLVIAVLLALATGCIPLPARNFEYSLSPITLQRDTIGSARLIPSNNDSHSRGSPFTLALAIRDADAGVDSARINGLRLRTESDSTPAFIGALKLERDSRQSTRWVGAAPQLAIPYGSYELTGVLETWRGVVARRDTLGARILAKPTHGWMFWPWSFFNG